MADNEQRFPLGRQNETVHLIYVQSLFFVTLKRIVSMYSFFINGKYYNAFDEIFPNLVLMDKTICRFDCWSVKESKDYKGVKQDEEIHLGAVASVNGEEHNAVEVNNFSEYTPAGKLEFTVTNKAVFGLFKPGFSYYLTIEEVPLEGQSQYIQDYVNSVEDG